MAAGEVGRGLGVAREPLEEGLDADALRRTLEAALLSDDELSAPAASW